MRVKYLLFGVLLGVLISSAVVVLAGNLDPLSGPSGAASQMVTLEQIYDRLDTGAADPKMTSFTEPGSGPGAGTMHSLDEIMSIAPAADDSKGAAPGDVLNGKTYWGLRSGGMWGQQTGTMPIAGVPKTGQTSEYADGDDGDLEKGVAWPNPRFTIHDSGTPAEPSDDTVTDNLTGLMWARNANHGTKKWDGGVGGDHPALDYCITLTLANYRDWRLPNVQELHSLIDFSQSFPALPDGHPFSGVQPANYWSSTSDYFDAWYVNLTSGQVDNGDKSHAYYVWPVRGGQ